MSPKETNSRQMHAEERNEIEIKTTHDEIQITWSQLWNSKLLYTSKDLCSTIRSEQVGKFSSLFNLKLK